MQVLFMDSSIDSEQHKADDDGRQSDSNSVADRTAFINIVGILRQEIPLGTEFHKNCCE